MDIDLLLILLAIVVTIALWYAHESSKNAHLCILRVLDDAREPLLGKDICKATNCWRSTVYVHLNRMTRDGFILATEDKEKRNGNIPLLRYTLSRKGRELLRKIEECL